jgi:hypothetical protein
MHTKPCTLGHVCARIRALYNILLLCKLQDVVREHAHFSPVSIVGCAFTVIKFILDAYDAYRALFLHSPNFGRAVVDQVPSARRTFPCPLFTPLRLEMDVRIPNVIESTSEDSESEQRFCK